MYFGGVAPFVYHVLYQTGQTGRYLEEGFFLRPFLVVAPPSACLHFYREDVSVRSLSLVTNDVDACVYAFPHG